jgi:toxin YoeB
MRPVLFAPGAFEQYNEWIVLNKKMHTKIAQLIVAIAREPFSGIGKPEPLKHEWQGYWSRRIDAKHRLVYRLVYRLLEDGTLEIANYRDHYPE